MALAFIQSAANSSDASDSTVAVTVSSTGAGRLIAAYVGWEGATGSTASVTDGTTAFTAGTLKDSGASTSPSDDNHAQWFFLLVSNSGKTTITANWTAARAYKRVHVYEFSYTGTAALDVENQTASTGVAVTSGVVTTTGTDEVVFGCYKEYSANLLTLPLVNSVAADGSVNNSPGGSNSASWYRILTATFAGGAATGTSAGLDPWIDNLISFKVTAGGGGVVIPVFMNQYRQRKN